MRRPLAALFVALAACGEARTSPPGDTPDERCAAWAEVGPAIALDRASLEATLGPPDSVSTTVEPNRHIPDETDTILTLIWPGLSVTLRLAPDGRALVEDAVVRENRFLPWSEPAIGDAADAVIAILGEPEERDDVHLLYVCGSGPVNEPIALELRSDTVRAVAYHYYVD